MIDIKKHQETRRSITSTNKKKTYEMSEYEICRWMCLIEAVDIIEQKCSQLGHRGDSVNWVKPIALQKYIDERTESLLFEIAGDLAGESACTT